MSKETENETGCCRRFDPVPWENKIVDWDHKNFVKDKVFTLFYMPVNFSKVIGRLMKKIETAEPLSDDAVCLSDHTSKWNMDIYVSVGKPVPGVENEVFNGKFFTRVYEGNFKQTAQWNRDFEHYTKEAGLKIEKLYMWYTTCPSCAKHYGKNYIVFVGKLAKN